MGWSWRHSLYCRCQMWPGQFTLMSPWFLLSYTYSWLLTLRILNRHGVMLRNIHGNPRSWSSYPHKWGNRTKIPFLIKKKVKLLLIYFNCLIFITCVICCGLYQNFHKKNVTYGFLCGFQNKCTLCIFIEFPKD